MRKRKFVERGNQFEGGKRVEERKVLKNAYGERLNKVRSRERCATLNLEHRNESGVEG